jgi:hypothetical protein
MSVANIQIVGKATIILKTQNEVTGEKLLRLYNFNVQRSIFL